MTRGRTTRNTSTRNSLENLRAAPSRIATCTPLYQPSFQPAHPESYRWRQLITVTAFPVSAMARSSEVKRTIEPLVG